MGKYPSKHSHEVALEAEGKAHNTTSTLRLDGQYLGLSSKLSTDAINMGGMPICDLKTGPKKDFHRLSATGYALVY